MLARTHHRDEDATADRGLLLLRLGLATLLISLHGAPRLVRAFQYFVRGESWPFVEFVGGLGVPFPLVFALLSTSAESIAALLVAVGLLTRPAALVIAINMVVAVYVETNGGDPFELPALYLLGAVVIAISGPGAYSLGQLHVVARRHLAVTCFGSVAAIVAAILLITVSAAGCRQSTDQAPGSDTPRESSGGARLVVTDETGGNLVIVDADAGRVVERIPVGKRPRGLRLSPDKSQVLVALSGSPIAGPGVDESTLPPPDRSADGIGVVDLAARRLVRVLPSGQDPETFDLSPDGRTLFVSNEETAEVSVLDVHTATIRGRVKVGGEPEGVTVRPDGRVIYVTSEADNAVFAIDAAALTVLARVDTGARPRSVAFTADGATAFVTAENAAAITVIDTATHSVAGTIPIPASSGTPTPPRPMGAELSPDGRSLFVSLGRARSVAVIDVTQRRLVTTFEDIGTRPWGLAVSRDGRRLFTANGPSGDVSIIDVASGKVERRVAVGGSPWGLIVVNE